MIIRNKNNEHDYDDVCEVGTTNLLSALIPQSSTIDI